MTLPQARGTSSLNSAVTKEFQGDLNADLNAGLSVDFKFTGKYYHKSIEQNAPNPGLSIKGLGTVGLPLGERDAQAIIAQAAQAPFGKGTETVVDTSVRDTWEIEPSAVTFENPMWKTWIENTALTTVWKSLGVAKYSTTPKCELYKLLLYQKGSHFLPHQDTEKSPGMFATIVVVLPSRFEGGEVHVSHAGQSAVLDVSESSAFNTSVLAWYTDVMHEVKPVKSGYRLALSYNLIHTSPNTPQPSLPDMHGVLDGLRKPLEQWNAGLYKTLPNPPFALHMFSHQYSQFDLNRGVQSLKGRDAHLIANLRPLLQEMGFSLCFANIKKTEKGCADDDGQDEEDYYGWGKRRRCAYDTYRDPTDHVSMLEVYESSLVLTHLVLVNQDGVTELDVDDFQVDDNAVVPRDAFERLSPDDQEYEGYMGNGAGELEQWYNRSALLIFRKEDEAKVLSEVCGATVVLGLLDVEDTPTPTALRIVAAVMEQQPSNDAASTILKHVVAWNDHATWNTVIPFLTEDESIEVAVLEALEVFDFEDMKPGIANLAKQQKRLQRRLDVTNLVASCLDEGAHEEWFNDLSEDAMESYKSASPLDVPTLVRLALNGDVHILKSTILPRTMAKAGTYDFHITLGSALGDAMRNLSQEEITSGLRDTLRYCAHQCLLTAVAQWKTPPPVAKQESRYGVSAPQPLAPNLIKERIGSIVKLCLAMQDDLLCIDMFNAAGIEHQMAALAAMKSDIEGASPPWVKELMLKALSTYSTPAVSDAPTLAWIAQEAGADAVEKLLSQKMSQAGSYEISVAMAKAFHERYVALSNTAGTPEQTKSTIRRIVSLCALSAIPPWELGVFTAGQLTRLGIHHPWLNAPQTGLNAKVKRILEIVEFCFTLGDLAPAAALFQLLLKKTPPNNTPLDARFKEIHMPLIAPLKETLARYGQSIHVEPFRSFLKNTVALYLSRVLGPGTPSARPPIFPSTTVGCGCQDCKPLDAWLKSTTPTHQLKAAQGRRSHLESVVRKHGVAHLVTTSTVTRGSPHTLVITKRPEVMAVLTWKASQKEALAFVKTVAEDAVLRQLMGERYGDVVAALQGTKVFVAGPMEVVLGEGVSIGMAPVNAVAGSSNASGSGAQQASQTVAGVKRKKSAPQNVIGVIDLT